MTDKPWLDHYPPGVPAEIGPLPHETLVGLIDEACTRFSQRTACHFMGRAISFADLDRDSRAFAVWLQGRELKAGDRIALMMPNVPQYPIAVLGALRAGLVVVNTNPLYTARELAHQLSDSGAKAIVVLENMAATVAACRGETALDHVVVARVGDCLPRPKGWVVDLVLKHVRKAIPPYDLPGAVGFRTALSEGASGDLTPSSAKSDDPAVLQYTGGTTGVAKGATLTHANILANVVQSNLWYGPALDRLPEGEPVTTVAALPFYHIFGFTVTLLLGLRTGGACVLIPNPRDLPALIKAIKPFRIHSFPGVNTLFAALSRHPDAAGLDWSGLVLSVGGGMAVQPATAERWKAMTGCAICEGYGLSESSPVASCNRTDTTRYTGTIGLPVPSTDIAILDIDGDAALDIGARGEIAIRGPQIMAGYWGQPEETARIMTPDGFMRTGDIGVMDDSGMVTVVDRKKDMINVSGFNVYPNEVESVVAGMPGVLEAAAVAIPDADSGEAVRLFVVAEDDSVTEEAVKAFCRQNLTGYKRPREVVFRDELPKTNVGKVLRRALRD